MLQTVKCDGKTEKKPQINQHNLYSPAAFKNSTITSGLTVLKRSCKSREDGAQVREAAVVTLLSSCHNWASGVVLLCHSVHGCLFLSHKRCVLVYFCHTNIVCLSISVTQTLCACLFISVTQRWVVYFCYIGQVLP